MRQDVAKYHEQEEDARFRDLVQQVTRFLKYAPKGTAPGVLRREARIFEGRLANFEKVHNRTKISELQGKLQRITEEKS